LQLRVVLATLPSSNMSVSKGNFTSFNGSGGFELHQVLLKLMTKPLADDAYVL